MSPLYPCGKPCSRGTHNETVKNLALFSSIINGIMKESRFRISIPWEYLQFFNRIENSITFSPYRGGSRRKIERGTGASAKRNFLGATPFRSSENARFGLKLAELSK